MSSIDRRSALKILSAVGVVIGANEVALWAKDSDDAIEQRNGDAAMKSLIGLRVKAWMTGDICIVANVSGVSGSQIYLTDVQVIGIEATEDLEGVLIDTSSGAFVRLDVVKKK